MVVATELVRVPARGPLVGGGDEGRRQWGEQQPPHGSTPRLDPLHSALCNGEMGERDRGERREESEKVKSGIGGTYCKLFVLWSCGVCAVELVADSVLELGGM